MAKSCTCNVIVDSIKLKKKKKIVKEGSVYQKHSAQRSIVAVGIGNVGSKLRFSRKILMMRFIKWSC